MDLDRSIAEDEVTIDERLERLTERHEALTESIELMHRDWESRWQQMETRWQQTETRWQQVIGALEQDAENIRALARIAELHHQRLERLEGSR